MGGGDVGCMGGVGPLEKPEEVVLVTVVSMVSLTIRGMGALQVDALREARASPETPVRDTGLTVPLPEICPWSLSDILNGA